MGMVSRASPTAWWSSAAVYWTELKQTWWSFEADGVDWTELKLDRDGFKSMPWP